MGRKISVDSATMMNKGLEVIEAYFLFGLSHEKIDVVIHPQSIIHSMAYFDDGSVLSQLGLPDMRTAISYALSHPDRHTSGVEVLDLTQQKPLEFYLPDLDVFSCLRLAYNALKTGQSAAGTLSAANEIAVAAFLDNKIGFLEIGRVLEKVLETVPVVSLDTLDDVMENDRLSREVARTIIETACG
jgi:1-deoxy-D-xylulose-5-phosphate reductoisomerase